MTSSNATTPPSAMSPFSALSLPDCSMPTGLMTTTTRKRTRASPEQLQILENVFLTNKSPDNKHRKQLSEQLRMSERSIQIWFQNRRAKEKLTQKRNQKLIDPATLQEQFFQPLPNNHHPLSPSHLGWPTQSMLAYQSNQDWLTDNYITSLPFTSQDKSMVRASDPELFSIMSYMQHLAPTTASPPSSTDSSFSFSVGSPSPDEILQTVDPTQLNLSSSPIEFCPQSLNIGTWCQSSDYARNVTMYCAYYPDRRAFEWYIQDSENCFKIVVHSIDHITYYGNISDVATIRVNLRELPLFYTKKIVDLEWRRCKDFTENDQASTVFAHTIEGCHTYEAKQALSTIQSLDPSLPILMDPTAALPEPFQVPFLEDIISY